MKKFFNWFVHTQEKLLLEITGMIFILSTIMLSYQVIGRKIFGLTIPGYDQIIIWSSIISMYLMLGLALKEGRHIRVTLLVRQIKKESLRIYTELVGTIISVVYVSIAFYATYSYMLKSKEIGSKAIMFNFPTWIVYLFICIGFLLLLIFYIERIVGFIRFSRSKDRSIMELLDNEK